MNGLAGYRAVAVFRLLHLRYFAYCNCGSYGEQIRSTEAEGRLPAMWTDLCKKTL